MGLTLAQKVADGDVLSEKEGVLVKHSVGDELGLNDPVTLLHWVVVPDPLKEPLIVKLRVGLTLVENVADGDVLSEKEGVLVKHSVGDGLGLNDPVTLLHWVVVPDPL